MTTRKKTVKLGNVIKESKSKGLSSDSNETECMSVNKREKPRSELQIGDIKMRQEQKFIYLRNGCEMWHRNPTIQLNGERCHKTLNNLQRNKTISLEMSERLLTAM